MKESTIFALSLCLMFSISFAYADTYKPDIVNENEVLRDAPPTELPALLNVEKVSEKRTEEKVSGERHNYNDIFSYDSR